MTTNNNSVSLAKAKNNYMSGQHSSNSLSSASLYKKVSAPQDVLAHSVMHLREDSTSLPSIKAIAFTDRTHNIQWCKADPTLKEFLQKKNSVNLR